MKDGTGGVVETGTLIEANIEDAMRLYEGHPDLVQALGFSESPQPYMMVQPFITAPERDAFAHLTTHETNEAFQPRGVAAELIENRRRRFPRTIVHDQTLICVRDFKVIGENRLAFSIARGLESDSYYSNEMDGTRFSLSEGVAAYIAKDPARAERLRPGATHLLQMHQASKEEDGKGLTIRKILYRQAYRLSPFSAQDRNNSLEQTTVLFTGDEQYIVVTRKETASSGPSRMSPASGAALFEADDVARGLPYAFAKQMANRIGEQLGFPRGRLVMGGKQGEQRLPLYLVPKEGAPAPVTAVEALAVETDAKEGKKSKEEVEETLKGFYERDVYELKPLALLRDLVRGGQPTLFWLMTTPLTASQVVKRLRSHAGKNGTSETHGQPVVFPRGHAEVVASSGRIDHAGSMNLLLANKLLQL